MTNRQRVLNELQMITGVVTNDVEYEMYLLLKDGTFFKDMLQEQAEASKVEQPRKLQTPPTLEEWFNSLGGV